MNFGRPIAPYYSLSRRLGASAGAATGARRSRPGAGVFLRTAFYATAAAGDVAAILLGALASGLTYHWAFYDPDGMVANFLLLGSAIAVFFVTPAIVRDEYALANFAPTRASLGHAFMHWNVAFVSAILLAFLSKTSSDLSRGTMVVFYVVGFAAVAATRLALRRLARRVAAAEGPAARRIFLVGSEPELLRFTNRYSPTAHGMRVLSAAVIRSEDSAPDDLALAAALARIQCPDDILILMPWSNTKGIEACIDAFLKVPASICLGPERILERFGEMAIDHDGGVPRVRLVRSPLRTFDRGVKRLTDIAGAAIGLVVLSPALAAIALAIKLDSPGPIFFAQRRYGFNQEPFRIFKFRSMCVVEDGRNVRQATAKDDRITQVGALLRRWNLDELPQLFNVLRGEMSLVGPRPHALVHDQEFDRTVTLYARRHNVKPGITGWAQVNGYRGEIVTPHDIRERVAHDLYYIDHWSPTFDLKIMLLTLFSRRAYRNAR